MFLKRIGTGFLTVTGYSADVRESPVVPPSQSEGGEHLTLMGVG